MDDHKYEPETFSEFLLDTARGQERTIAFAEEILRDNGGKAISVTVKDEITRPQRAGSPPKDHTFNDVNAFVAYLEKHGGDNTIVLADVSKLRIVATLDESLKTGFEGIHLIPQVSQAAKPWIDAINHLGSFDILVFADFVLRNRRAVKEPNGREVALALSQIKLSIETTVHQGQGRQAINGVTVKHEISGKEQTDFVEIPETIKVEVPLFVGRDPRCFEVDLIVNAVKRGDVHVVQVAMSSPDLVDVIHAEFQSMLDEVKAVIVKGVVGLGTVEYGEWDYIVGPERNRD